MPPGGRITSIVCESGVAATQRARDLAPAADRRPASTVRNNAAVVLEHENAVGIVGVDRDVDA
jgi:hypothetical protein